MPARHVRKRKLIKPGLQLRMSGIFVGLVLLMLMLQFSLLTAELHEVSNGLPHDHSILLSQTNAVAWKLIAYSGAVFLPLTLMVGILSTFRVAGPLFRIERFLRELERGESPEDFTLRRKDELKELAQLLNDATRPMRRDRKAASETVTADSSSMPPANDRDAA